MLPKGPLLGLLLLISKLKRLDRNVTNLDELCAAAGWGQFLAQGAASKQSGAFQLFPFQQAALTEPLQQQQIARNSLRRK